MALKRKNRKGIVFMGLGLLMMGAALSLTGYNLWDERRAEEESNQVLEQLYLADEALAEPRTAGGRLEDITGSAENVPDYVLNPDMPMPAVTVDGRQYIGVLTVPSLSLSLPVMSEWSYDNLKIAPCRYQGSAYKEDLIVAGHNYRKHFSPLKTLPIGAEICSVSGFSSTRFLPFSRSNPKFCRTISIWPRSSRTAVCFVQLRLEPSLVTIS